MRISDKCRNKNNIIIKYNNDNNKNNHNRSGNPLTSHGTDGGESTPEFFSRPDILFRFNQLRRKSNLVREDNLPLEGDGDDEED